MPKKPVLEQPDREDRIIFDIVVDAYDDSERAMGWYYYLQDQMQFPFRAKCKLKATTSPLKAGDEVEVISMADEDDCMSEVFVQIRHADDQYAVPLALLECLSTNAQTREAVEDWHYWVAMGYEY